MTHPRAAFWALAFVVVAPVASAVAQPMAPGGGVRRPAFSPYLGMLAGSQNPGLNYLGIVRPQQQMQQQFQQQVGQLSQSLQQNNQDLQNLNNSVYGVDTQRAQTGHAATFGNTLQYFSSNPAYGNGSGRGSMFNSIGGGMNRPSVGGISGPSSGGGSIGSRFGGNRSAASRPTSPTTPRAVR